jgi:hypothetical protein
VAKDTLVVVRKVVQGQLRAAFRLPAKVLALQPARHQIRVARLYESMGAALSKIVIASWQHRRVLANCERISPDRCDAVRKRYNSTGTCVTQWNNTITLGPNND